VGRYVAVQGLYKAGIYSRSIATALRGKLDFIIYFCWFKHISPAFVNVILGLVIFYASVN
jgi:hypothetical protein